MAKRIKKISPDQFTDETSLVLEVVAENVAREAASLVRKAARQSREDYSFYDFMRPRSGIFRDQYDPVNYLVNYALTVYANNASFRKKLQRESGREVLYAYMRHWISAEILKRTKSLILRAYLTELTSFANGEPFEE